MNLSESTDLSRRGFIGRAAFGALSAAALLGSLPGCNIIAPAHFIISGPPKRDAMFELEKRKTVVFVDDRQSQIPLRAAQIRRIISRSMTTKLMDNIKSLEGEMIDGGDAISLARNVDRRGELLPVGEIGKTVGADIIVYVEIQAFVLTTDGVTPRPTAVAGVRVLDVVNRKRLFPADDSTSQSWRVTSELEPFSPEAASSEAGQLKIYQALAEKLSDDLAKLFYRHVVRELGDNLDPPKR